MDKIFEALSQAFCEDCCERMQRAAAIVQSGVPLDRVQLDQLHQEFDTLFGGARAVHLPELEYYFRSMARYARYLRNRQQVGKHIAPSAWEKLLTGVSMGLRCGGERADCLKHCQNELPLLLHEIEDTLLR